jgi:hypothetical protein
MAEWRPCPGCGYSKHGCCPVCFPAEAERERLAEAAGAQRELEDRERRSAGLLWCDAHSRHDRCIRARPIAEVRAELRSERREPLTWQQAMAELRRRYASP